LGLVEQIAVIANTRLDFAALVRQLPTSMVAGVRVGERIVDQKVPFVGIPERACEMSLCGFVPVK
jgi:hypothetical protein